LAWKSSGEDVYRLQVVRPGLAYVRLDVQAGEVMTEDALAAGVNLDGPCRLNASAMKAQIETRNAREQTA
jgi:hypothetical protein